MRWTNYFIHPADNRYYVFTFSEKAHAIRFQASLESDDIPYERNELEFGVPRTHFNEALRHNHLLYADIREPFLANKGLRWGVLIITGAVLLLAIVGALSSRAYGQQMGSASGWEMSIQSRVSVPLAIAGVEAQNFSEAGLSASWAPLPSQSFGVRVTNRLRESWTIGSGIMWMRRNYSITLDYANDTLGINTTDTISLLRATCYRIPIIAETRVELGNGYFITAAGGVGVEFSPSDAFVNGFTSGTPSRDYEAYLGRINWGSIPIMAEFGFEKEPRADVPGYYLGVFWSRSIGDAYWVENVWQSSNVRVVGQGAIASTLAGVELRILLK
jgi:uncharacterized membrane protein (DUF441 family)